MNEQITLLAEDLPIKKMNTVSEHMDNAHAELQNVYANAILADGFAGANGRLFAGAEEECAAILSLLARSATEISQLRAQLEAGASMIGDADDSFQGALTAPWWEKFQNGVRLSAEHTPAGKTLGNAAPLVTLLSPDGQMEEENAPGKIQADGAVEKSEALNRE